MAKNSEKKLVLILSSIFLFLVMFLVRGEVFWWSSERHQQICQSQLKDYNQAIQSCGVMNTVAEEAWKDPAATEKLVEELSDLKMPKCPSGGTYSMVYTSQPYSTVPKLVCSLEKSHGHQSKR